MKFKKVPIILLLAGYISKFVILWKGLQNSKRRPHLAKQAYRHVCLKLKLLFDFKDEHAQTFLENRVQECSKVHIPCKFGAAMSNFI